MANKKFKAPRKKVCYFTENNITYIDFRDVDMLKRFKDDAKEVNAGYECGISFNKFNSFFN